LDSSLIAIGVETEYKSVGRSLSGWNSKKESDAPIVAESEIVDFAEAIEADSTIRLIHVSYQADL
jgi:hypothetical protein